MWRADVHGQPVARQSVPVDSALARRASTATRLGQRVPGTILRLRQTVSESAIFFPEGGHHWRADVMA